MLKQIKTKNKQINKQTNMAMDIKTQTIDEEQKRRNH